MAVPDVQDILQMLEDGRADDVMRQLESALPQEPANPTTRLLLALAYERVGRLGQALEAWNTALFLAPGSAAARSGLRRLRKAYPDLKPELATPPVPPSEPPEGEDSDAAHQADDNLDQLIKDLEGARIVPNPDIDFEDVDLDGGEDDEGLVSETLARIYAAQQQFIEAAQVYELLAMQHPERAEEFHTRAQEMKMRGQN